MMEANPNLDYTTVWNILTATCYQPVGGLPNNSYGWGRINALAAVEAAMAIETDPYITVFSYEIQDPTGNNDGIWQRGEIVDLVFTLHNSGAAGDITATVTTADANVTVLDGDADFGTMASGALADNSGDPIWVQSLVTTDCGHYVRFNIIVTDGGKYTDTLVADVNVDYGPGMLVATYPMFTSVIMADNTINSVTASWTRIYFCTQANSTIYVMDPGTGDSVRTMTGPASNLTGISFDSRRNNLWLESNAGSLYRLDTLGAVQATYSSPASTRADIAYDSTEDVVWVTSGTTVYKVDAATGSNLGNITCSVSGTIRGIIVEPRGETQGTLVLMVDRTSTKWLFEFSKTGTKLDSVKIGENESKPRGADFDPVRRVYYICHSDPGQSWYYDENFEIQDRGAFYCPEAQTPVLEKGQVPELTLSAPNPSVTRDFFSFTLSLPQDDHARVALYDVSGRMVSEIFSGNLSAGQHRFSVNLKKPAGVYILRAEVGKTAMSRKLVISE